MSDASIFCPLPFSHVAVSTNGNYMVCCRHPTPAEHVVNINNNPVQVWQTSKYYLEVKNSFKNNEKHPGCNDCWHQESIGQTSASYRKRVEKDHQIFKVNTDTDKLLTVEIQLGNLCNLTCLMCNEKDSSAILAENIKLGVNHYQQKEFTWSDTAFENLFQLLSLGPKILTIRGGEPLYNKNLLDILEKLPDNVCSTTMLHITTNGTVWNDRWAQAIKKFRLVRFMFSVDATEELYEYMRFPAKWNTLVENIKEINKLNNVKSLVQCVVQNLNVNQLLNMIQWAQKENLWLTFSQLTNPEYLAITNLPLALKKQALDHLEQCLLVPNLTKQQVHFINACQDQLNYSLNEKDDSDRWNKFLNYINPRDQLRNNSHRKFLVY